MKIFTLSSRFTNWILFFAICNVIYLTCNLHSAFSEEYDYFQLIDEVAPNFNVDVILDQSDGDKPQDDIDCGAFLYVTKQFANANENDYVDPTGFPSDGKFNKEGWNYEVSTNFSGNNAYRIEDYNPLAINMFYRLYNEIRIIATTNGVDGEEKAELEVQFLYSDGSTGKSILQVPDWEKPKASSNAYKLTDAMEFGSVDNIVVDSERVFLYYFILKPDKTKQLQSLVLKKNPGNNCHITFFGGVAKHLKAPQIESFNPTSARKDDKITITGKNFINGNYKVNNVKIGNSSVNYVVISATEIEVTINQENGKIFVESAAGQSTSSQEFTLDTSMPEVKYTYFTIKEEPITDISDQEYIEKNAVKRLKLNDNTFEYALFVELPDAMGTGSFENFGNPSPAVGKHWYKANTRVECSVNGSVEDTFKTNTRYVVTGYKQYRQVNNDWSSENKYFYYDPMPDSQNLTIYMSGPARLQYKWLTQYAVNNSAIPISMGNHISLTTGQTGIGKWWFNKGSSVTLNAQNGCLKLIGYRDYTKDVSQTITEKSVTFYDLSEPVSIVWQYESYYFDITTDVGNYVDIANVSNLVDDTVEPVKMSSLETQGQGNELYIWAPFEKKVYPLIGNRVFQLEWNMKSSQGCDQKVITNISTQWPKTSHYDHVANTHSVNLNPSDKDEFSFKSLKYTDADAVVSPTMEFTATKKGKTTLLFTKSPNGIATGDVNSEYAYVRVVETILWNEKNKIMTAIIGEELSKGEHDSRAGHNGYVFWEKARYNTLLYNRDTMQGPIFPVNTDTQALDDDLLVIWYTMNDNIAWPSISRTYKCTWPTPAKRIVIASQLGSDGKNMQGEDQTWPDKNNIQVNYFDPIRYKELTVYFQNDPTLGGYNPNEEHALIAPSFKYADAMPRPQAVFSLRNDLNISSGDHFTSMPMVLIHYFDTRLNRYKMEVFDIQTTDVNCGYTFDYTMKAGDILVAPYPVNLVIGVAAPDEIFGKDVDTTKKCYWEDHKGQAWAISGDTDTEPELYAYFWYPLDATFWFNLDEDNDGKIEGPAEPIPWLPGRTIGSGEGFPSDLVNKRLAVQVSFNVRWPSETPILKAGETLTFPGGEYRADNPASKGLPGVLGWAAGQVVYDSMNPDMDNSKVFSKYLVRLAPVLEQRTVPLLKNDLPSELQPASGNVNVVNGLYYFKELHSGLRNRIFYDPLNQELGFRGFVNDKTLGDNDLTATPPSVYVLQPNIMSLQERDLIKDLAPTGTGFNSAVEELYSLSRKPTTIDDKDYTIGLQHYHDIDGNVDEHHGEPLMALGPGLALMPNSALLDPLDNDFARFTEGYVTLAENNHESLGDLPVALHVIKVTKELYRGAIKTIFSDNVFDEKIVLRHTADFGANTEDLIFVWYYREEDGTEEAPPNPPASMGKWKQLEGGLEYNLAGAGSALLVDNLFFCRYHHKNIGANQQIIWSDWAGAANSRPPQSGEYPAETYQPQLAEGWVKRVINGINPFEARVQDFSNIDSPATYVSMIQQAGQRYEGNVAFNPQKDVIENFGLIELYQTVLDRAMSLSINLDNVANSSGVVTALLLATSRINGFYCLLGNEAYTDALDPTIGFGSNDVTYGSLLPTIFAFQNQVPNLLDEELKLLRGRDEEGARPAYNRLLWNFTKGEGEAAYAMSYNIQDFNSDGFINEADGRALYPQGHGDAWGHYLTSLKVYYDLLTHQYFNWEARSEKFQIEGVVIDVDYFDERKFAESAASKAKVGCQVVNMTYRSKYVEDPDGQWQGYKDTNRNRSWGVMGWGRKAALGAYFDWATANFILPSEDNDPAHTGVKKVDRSTVPDLVEIASQARSIQQTIDNADSGLNPLGLSTDAVPFDIDSTRLRPGVSSSTHFEQVAERAKKALENAQTIFDYANDLKSRIREVSISTQDFSEQVMDQDRDYRNRLIEIFGTPYQGTIGSGKIYPAGYSGPDYFTYMYIDVNEVNDESIPPPNDTMKAYFQPMNEQFVETVDTSSFWSSAISGIGASNGSVDSIPAAFKHFFNTDIELSNYTTFDVSGVLEIEFPMSASSYSFQAPEGWGMRASPGEIQIALIELLKAETDFKLELNDYAGLMSDIQTKVDLLKAFSDKNAEELKIGDQWAQKTLIFNTALTGLSLLQTSMEAAAETSEEVSDIAAEAMPKVTGLSNDATSAARASTKLSSSIGKKMAKATAYAAQFATYLLEQEKEIAEMDKDTNIDKVNYRYEVQQMLKDIEGDMGNEAGKRVSIFKAREHMSQVSEKYRAILGKGLRLLEERKAFNARVAAKTQGKRYMDMAFRINMNNALSKYHSAFDIAARYVYLAAKAYDYDTNLSDRDPASPKTFMSDIMQERTLGQTQNGNYVIGHGGLGDILAKMMVNYDALKGQMGFNNPQNETGRFSLRKELFRIKDDGNTENDSAWRDILTSSVKEDLWAVPEFRKYCRPFITEDAGFQPGIVISFASNIISGKNFFGKKLGGGDHAYDSTNFATKIRSVGMWFDGYDNANLSETPRCYIIPTGSDIMLVPDSMELDSREWTIVDQKIPIPLPISNSDLNNPGWIPSLDGLNGSMIKIRRFSSFRAYHDNGYFDDTQISFDSRLIGRSVWNTKWLIIIPGATFHYDKHYGLKTFIETVKDIKLFFQTYAISGN